MGSNWLWLETQENPQNGQNVCGFQVRTPICHIVPVSRAYRGGGPKPWRGKAEKFSEKKNAGWEIRRRFSYSPDQI